MDEVCIHRKRLMMDRLSARDVPLVRVWMAIWIDSGNRGQEARAYEEDCCSSPCWFRDNTCRSSRGQRKGSDETSDGLPEGLYALRQCQTEALPERTTEGLRPRHRKTQPRSEGMRF